MADLLLVDDDADVTDVLSDFLRDQGHEVRVAVNGEDGLRLVHERPPELILLDVEMPILQGPRMAYRMFVEDAGQERIPILFLSGIPDLQRIAACVGTKYYLTKPYSLDQLLETICTALYERAAPTYPKGDTHDRLAGKG
jgi:DNA-binding response OmpR family regulator